MGDFGGCRKPPETSWKSSKPPGMLKDNEKKKRARDGVQRFITMGSENVESRDRYCGPSTVTPGCLRLRGSKDWGNLP